MTTILIFDREKDLADMLKEILEEELFYKITIATTPEEAIKKIEKQKPEVVLLDPLFHLGFDYEGMIRKVKEISRDTQIVITTAIDNELHIQRAFNAGAVRNIPKPCSLEELKRILEETIRGELSDPNLSSANFR